MKQRLQQNQAQQTGQTQHQDAKQRRDFAGPEEIIRADRDGTQPPDSLAARLADSIAGEPAPPKPWWKRLLG